MRLLNLILGAVVFLTCFFVVILLGSGLIALYVYVSIQILRYFGFFI
jgi:hypothetical protein